MDISVALLAVDKDSSDSYRRSILVDSKAKLVAEWEEFKKVVPFSRWYEDNTVEDCEDEELTEQAEKWLEELE